MDLTQAILEYLVGYGLPGLIAAYFASRYLQKEKEMELLRDRYEARIETWFNRYEHSQRERLLDWQKWSDQRTAFFNSTSAPGRQPEGQLLYPRSYEMVAPPPVSEGGGDD